MKYADVYRWIVSLIAVGLVIVGLIYLWDMRQARLQNPFGIWDGGRTDSAMRCFLAAGAMVILHRGISLIESKYINDKGLPGVGEIISVACIGRPENSNDRNWYTIVIRVIPDDSRQAAFTTKVTQLIKKEGRRNIEPGVRAPLKYLPGRNKIILTATGAVGSVKG